MYNLFFALEQGYIFVLTSFVFCFVKPLCSQNIVCQQTLLFHQLTVNKTLVSVVPTEMALADFKNKSIAVHN